MKLKIQILHKKLCVISSLFVFSLILLNNPASGQIRAGASYLKIVPGTRQLGIAGSLTGTIDHISAFHANPAATGFLREWQWSASYTRWIPDVNDASFFYGRRVALPWSRHTRLGLGVSYLGH